MPMEQATASNFHNCPRAAGSNSRQGAAAGQAVVVCSTAPRASSCAPHPPPPVSRSPAAAAQYTLHAIRASPAAGTHKNKQSGTAWAGQTWRQHGGIMPTRERLSLAPPWPHLPRCIAGRLPACPGPHGCRSRWHSAAQALKCLQAPGERRPAPTISLQRSRCSGGHLTPPKCNDLLMLSIRTAARHS